MIKLYVFYGGDIICRDISQLDKGLAVDEEKELANPVFLIQHPKGTLVWDSGLSDELVKHPEGIEAWIFHLRMQKTLRSQMEEAGFRPDKIDFFAFSHIHVDHTGNANYFKNATLIMQEKEYQLAFLEEKKPQNYTDFKELKDAKTKRLQGDFDLFGDGTVRFISTPGHTPGHQSLLVQLEETGAVIISGDISYYKEHLTSKGVPSFNSSPRESLASIEKILELQKEHQAQLWIQHDKDQFEALRHSPLYYQ